MNKQLEAIYLDWVNDYLTIERFAEDYQLTVSEATELIHMLKNVHERAFDKKTEGYI